MPRRKRQQDEGGGPARPAPRFTPAALDALLAEVGGLQSPGDVEPLFRALKQAVVERALGAELTHHLGYAPGATRPGPRGPAARRTTATGARRRRC